MEQALAILSDGAFKLYAYLCLHAERRSARLRFRHSELAQSLGKSPRSISSYLNELRCQDVCKVQAAANQHQTGSIEIADRFWPYHKQPSRDARLRSDPLHRTGPAAFPEPGLCPRTFSAADEKLAAECYQRHVPLEQIERAYLLGCARKYVALLNHPGVALISSLHYFTALLSEVEELKVSADYWSYLSHKLDRLEQRWRRDPATPQVGQANFAPPNQRSATQDKGETR